MCNTIACVMAGAEVLKLVELLAWGATIGAFFWGIREWCNEKKIRHAKFLAELLSSLRTSENLETFYKIDYEKNWYNKEFHESKMESRVDALLAKLSYLCYLADEKIIEELEIAAFKYEIQRCLSNPQIINYLYNIHHYAKLNGNATSPFSHLEEYGKRYGFIKEKEFDDPQIWKTNSSYNNFLEW